MWYNLSNEEVLDMTEKGRRLTIERIDKYREEVNQKEREIKHNCLMIGSSAIIIIVSSLATVHGIITEEIWRILLGAILFCKNSFDLTSKLINTIKTISRKTGIEIKIEDLEAQLKLDEFEQEEKGKSI